MTPDVAMQTRCVHCLREQYEPIVLAVSFGETTCAFCGQASKEMTYPEYQAALATYQAALAAARARQEPPE